LSKHSKWTRGEPRRSGMGLLYHPAGAAPGPGGVGKTRRALSFARFRAELVNSLAAAGTAAVRCEPSTRRIDSSTTMRDGDEIGIITRVLIEHDDLVSTLVSEPGVGVAVRKGLVFPPGDSILPGELPGGGDAGDPARPAGHHQAN